MPIRITSKCRPGDLVVHAKWFIEEPEVDVGDLRVGMVIGRPYMVVSAPYKRESPDWSRQKDTSTYVDVLIPETGQTQRVNGYYLDIFERRCV